MEFADSGMTNKAHTGYAWGPQGPNGAHQIVL